MARWRRRAQLRKITSLGRVRRCGYCTNTDSGPTLAITDNADGTRTAGYGGLATCGSVWVCPQCAAVVATRRADDLDKVMRAVKEAGGSVWMFTVTMRHARGDRLGMDVEWRARAARLEERQRVRRKLAAWRGGETRPKRTVKDPAPMDRAALEFKLRRDLGWLERCPPPGERLAPADHDIVAERARRAADAEEERLVAEQRGCWDAAADAWTAVHKGGAAQKDKKLFGGMLGWAKATEVTDGDNGWHVHAHAIICFRDDVSEELMEASGYAARAFERWRAELQRHGFDASGQVAADGSIPGYDMRKGRLGEGALFDYLTKLAHEATGSHRKEGRRRGGRTPMQLLADAVETYRVEDIARWWEWEAASQNRRQLTWSEQGQDLRAFAGLGKDKTDEQIAEEEVGGEHAIAVDRDSWDWIEHHALQTELLDAAEVGGFDGARRWLNGYGLAWTEVDLPPAQRALTWEQRMQVYHRHPTP